MSFVSALSGYKTYLVAAATAIGAVAAIATGSLTPVQGALTVGLALAQTFLRSGSKADAARAAVLTTASLVEQLAPAVAKLMPSAAAAIAVIDKAAAEVTQVLTVQAAPVAAIEAPIAPADEPVAEPVPQPVA